MNIFEAAALGVLQGLTEFLPVSSSGHLVLGKAFFGIRLPGIAFEVFVHFGTLLSILVMFRSDVMGLVGSLTGSFARRRDLKAYYVENKDFRQVTLIIIGTIPAGFIGLALKGYIEEAFGSVIMVGYAMIFTGFVLLATKWIGSDKREMSPGRSLLVGFAQALAVLPGISRSGSTISAAMFSGVSGEEATRFSFLLAIPAILGATLLQTAELIEEGISGGMLWNLGVGAVTSFGVGCAAIWLLMGAVRRGRLSLFSWYCFAVGGAILLFS